MRYLLLLAALALAGCSSGLADLTAQLAKDPASVCLTVTSIYGTTRLARTGIQNGNVSCTNDGLSVSSRAPTVGGLVQ